MKALEHEVLLCARQWLDGGKTVYLCTIVACVGSSPRPVGSMLACTDSSDQIGSLSGGCVEEDLLDKIGQGQLISTDLCIVEYGVSAEENERLGLPCGGRLKVLIQNLTRDSGAPGWLEGILNALEERQCVRRVVAVSSGVTSLDHPENFQPLLLADNTLVQSFGPRMRRLLVGAGQLSQSVAELAVAMDYEVAVVDPRPEMLRQWRGPDVELVGGMPDDAVRSRVSDKHSVVITLTHDPRIDDMALMEALTTQAWYVGALGSQKTTEMRLARLRALELSEQQIQRLHAPVGIDIGSKTPIEIAISIMAELTALRRVGKPQG